jgi:DNA-binding NarL/FixJ family response regulator
MKTILIIEDHALMRRNVVTILKMEGYTALAAANGLEGLAIIANSKSLPDLILCDVMMPEMDGYSVLRELRADPLTSGIPFIFLTAKGEKNDLRLGMNLGADDYLTKPIARNDLVAALDARFARQHQQRPKFDHLFKDTKPLLHLGISPREAEVLLWIAQGKGNDDIAQILGISVQTVKKHVAAVLESLGVENRSSAAVRAMEALTS